MSDTKPALTTCAVTKRFGGVQALDRVNFELLRGEVHAICGENGAGKSTLIKILSGVHPYGSYEGEVIVGGKLAAFRSTRDAEQAGVAFIPQELALVPEMTVAENLFLGREPCRRGLCDWDRVYSEAARIMDRLRFDLDPTVQVQTLGIGRQQLLEIAKAVSKESQILVLDEPTAALTDLEVAILMDTVRDLRNRGMSLIYISHKLGEVFSVADRITVLRDGRSITTQRTSDTQPQQVIGAMVGREIADLFPKRNSTLGPVLLELRELSVAPGASQPEFLHGISLSVHAGEVLGIGGLMGAGRTELLMHLFGMWGHRTSGAVLVEGKPFDNPTPRKAIQHNLALVSEDRKRWGLFHEQSVGFNLSLSSLEEFTSLGFLDQSREVEANRAKFESLRVKASGLEAPVSSLSGGNQQKVVLGRALMTDPRIIMLDEPTRGIDVGAKIEVYEIINQLTARGCAVVLVSSELPELLGMSDRIIMLHEGHASPAFLRQDATQEVLLSAALGNPAQRGETSSTRDLGPNVRSDSSPCRPEAP